MTAGVILKHRQSPRRARLFLTLGIVVDLCVLGYFKYTMFVVNSWNDAFGTGWNVGFIVLPLAISFYTFQKIAYLVDAYRGKVVRHDFLNYCFFVMFFPQLIAGPIVHHSEIIPQIEKGTTQWWNLDRLAVAVTYFSIGLFKKAVIADGIAAYSTPVFNAVAQGEQLSLIASWVGALAYTFQIYFDFSGYSDMAIGLALLFGLRLPTNFASPYKSLSIIEFWRRWHMTLSRFLRDYLYIPLGGNRHGSTRRYLLLIITMVLGGLWHGAQWTFVIWGLLHGLYIAINHFWRFLVAAFGLRNRIPTVYDRPLKVFSWGLTFLCVVVGWVFFRSSSFDQAIEFLRAMAGLNGFLLPDAYRAILGDFAQTLTAIGIRFVPGDLAYVDPFGLLVLVILLGLTTLMPNTQQLMSKGYEPLSPDPVVHFGQSIIARIQWRMAPLGAIAAGTAMALSLFGVYGEHEFLYFQF